MKILYDAMGGDNAPEAILKGAQLAMDSYNIDPYFVGNPEILKPLLNDELKSHILEAKSVINNDEDPAMAIRKKKDSSIVVGYKALNSGDYDGFLSAGSTGALLAGGLFIAKRLPGISRAALPVLIPTLKGKTLLMDSGANMDTTPELLVNFAEMSSVYMENVMDIENPKIALLNVGEEASKGDKRTLKAYELLKDSDLNFVGNIEGRDIFFGVVDIIIVDGFVGNILLKSVEGTAGFIQVILKEFIKENPPNEAEGKYIQKLLAYFKSLLDYREIGGAPLLGIEKPVVKAHGSSNAESICNATSELIHLIDSEVIKKMIKD